MSTADQFVDLSSNNPIPDLAAYKRAGHTHICRKVSEGVGYHWFEGDGVADRAHDLGLRVGHYHWLRPDSSPTAQASFFVTNVKPHLKLGDWLMTDFERTASAADPSDVERAAQLHTFNVYVRQQIPDYPLYVYTGNWYLDGKPHCQAECRRWPIVMSDYSAIDKLPNPYGLHYVAWQFSETARVAGLSAPVDYNRWLVQPAPVKYPPDSPNWSDTVDEATLRKIARQEAINVARAIEFGGDYEELTEANHAKLHVWPGNGDRDRLTKLEGRVDTLETPVTK